MLWLSSCTFVIILNMNSAGRAGGLIGTGFRNDGKGYEAGIADDVDGGVQFDDTQGPESSLTRAGEGARRCCMGGRVYGWLLDRVYDGVIGIACGCCAGDFDGKGAGMKVVIRQGGPDGIEGGLEGGDRSNEEGNINDITEEGVEGCVEGDAKGISE
mmetsp:Transcript_10519/g.17656  ORF Transcript_10519/g.17656 Transcript_10519/m.17656 type:complete len:157 (-) Transcript_10519:778-1248(-)